MTDNFTLVNSEQISRIYGRIPRLDRLRLRAVNLDWRGPKITLRADLMEFPQDIPPDWKSAGVDTVQCHLQFLAVQEVVLTGWVPSGHPISLDTEATGHDRRMRVQVAGLTGDLRFSSNETVLVGHVSAFRIGEERSDRGRHIFSGKIDSLRHSTVPAPEVKVFHERL